MFNKRRRSSIPKETELEDLSQNLIPLYNKAPCAFLIHNLFSPDECTQLIRLAEEEGFDNATIAGPEGKQIMRTDIRSCGRCIIDDVKLADSIYERVLNAIRGRTPFEEKVMHAPWVSSSVQKGVEESRVIAVGLNERLRFIKYTKGHFFAPHQDIAFTRGAEFGEREGETSHITVQIYLNDKFKGGSTRFVCGNRYYDVQPRRGSALVFDHDLLHEGSLVTKGQKYSVRTDIMFQQVPRQMIPLQKEMPTTATNQDVIQEAITQQENNDAYDKFLNGLRTPSNNEDEPRTPEVVTPDSSVLLKERKV
jgi:hypothetical protein